MWSVGGWKCDVGGWECDVGGWKCECGRVGMESSLETTYPPHFLPILLLSSSPTPSWNQPSLSFFTSSRRDRVCLLPRSLVHGRASLPTVLCQQGLLHTEVRLYLSQYITVYHSISQYIIIIVMHVKSIPQCIWMLGHYSMWQ